MSVSEDRTIPASADGDLVHWMDDERVRLGRAGVPATAAGAFLLGVLITLGAVALYSWAAPRREALPPWRWGRGRLH